MWDSKDKVLFKLIFVFEVAKDNDLKRKEKIEKLLPDYRVRKIKKTFICSSNDGIVRIDSDKVEIKTNNIYEVSKILAAIKKVYNFDFNEFGEYDYLGLIYKFRNENFKLKDFEEFMNYVVNISTKDEYTVLLEVNTLKIFEDGMAAECRYIIDKEGIDIGISRVEGELNLNDTIEYLMSYMETQVELLKRKFEDGE